MTAMLDKMVLNFTLTPFLVSALINYQTALVASHQDDTHVDFKRGSPRILSAALFPAFANDA